MEVAAVEYITGSRTVFGVISTPFRLRLVHNFLPFLLILWALSPLGGQASLRVVFLHGVVSNATVPVSYLDSFSKRVEEYPEVTKVVFNSVLLAPPSSKVAHQDFFENLKIPLLEDFESRSRQTDDDGWYSIKPDQNLEYSSLIGLSTAGIPPEDRTFSNIETSYLHLDCSLTRIDDAEPGGQCDWWGEYGMIGNTVGTCYSGRWSEMTLSLARDLEYNISDPSTAPRKIYFGHRTERDGQFLGTTAECSTTTTYVEVSYTCSGKACVATAIRRSRLTHSPTTITWFDDDLLKQAAGESTTNLIGFFCPSFINSTQVEEFEFSLGENALVLFLNDPDNPFLDVNKRPDLSDLDNAVFSRRFAQLLNTFLLAYVAPLAVAGGFDPSANVNESRVPDGTGQGVAVNTTATLEKTKIVLGYDTTWLAVLMASSLVMLAAGIATVVLNLMRRGPEVLDSFTSMLRENQYAHQETGPSTEDASEKVRRLRKTRVMLGDVHPLEMNGHVAVTTMTDGDSVQPLRSGRLYY